MIDRPRLLFLCQTLPYPPDGGVWIRTYHVLRLLARDFDVTMLCFERMGTASGRDDGSVARSLEHLSSLARVECFPIPQARNRARFVRDHLMSLLTGRPYTNYLYDSAPFSRRLSEVLEAGFDVVHIDSLVDLSRYLPALGSIPAVCVHHNVESELLRRRARIVRGWRAAYLRHQADLLAAEERRWAPEVALNVMVSDEDALVLARIAPGARTVTVPNGVDTGEFTPAPGGERGCVFVGGTSWFPNLDALDYWCDDILPRLRALRPDAEPGTWVGQASPQEKEDYRKRAGVTLTGYVPDVRPFMRDAAVFVVPLRVGGGTRLKILNAWAMGNAIVSTSVGCEGLEARNGENILIADTPESFAAAVHRLLGDTDLRRRLGRAGRETAERLYSWDVIGSEMARHYLDIASEGRGPAGAQGGVPF